MRIIRAGLFITTAGLFITTALPVSNPMFERASADDASLLASRFFPSEQPRLPAESGIRYTPRRPAPSRPRPRPRHQAPLEVARVLRRHPPCARVKPGFIHLVAREAEREDLDAALLAATVAVESGCNQYAISRSGAVGYMQIRPRVWRERYDFTERYNLFNARDNVRVGAMILGDLTRTHGLREGVRRYQGTGQNCAACDARYASKIFALAKGER